MVRESFNRNKYQPVQLLVVLLLFAGTALTLQAQQKTGNLEGTVLDKTTKRSLELVNVVIEGTNLGAATSTKGRYEYFVGARH